MIEYLLARKKFSSKKKWSFNLSFIEIKWETIANKCSFEVGVLVHWRNNTAEKMVQSQISIKHCKLFEKSSSFKLICLIKRITKLHIFNGKPIKIAIKNKKKVSSYGNICWNYWHNSGYSHKNRHWVKNDFSVNWTVILLSVNNKIGAYIVWWNWCFSIFPLKL